MKKWWTQPNSRCVSPDIYIYIFFFIYNFFRSSLGKVKLCQVSSLQDMFSPPHHPWAAPKKPILNRVKNIEVVENYGILTKSHIRTISLITFLAIRRHHWILRSRLRDIYWNKVIWGHHMNNVNNYHFINNLNIERQKRKVKYMKDKNK